ncbi:MAG: hypothetical protein J6J38_04890 [Lachnospiraceae bacterium]|nr:hypothetical protein [Lachnospiraceae bacterium]
MILQISEIVDAQGGLVLSRKEAKDPEADVYRYKRLTLRSLTEGGYISDDDLEDFYTNESLNNAWFTSHGDVVIRLFSPLCPTVIEESRMKLLVPSQLAILKVRDRSIISPEFLRLSLSQKGIQEHVSRIERGTAQRTVKLGTIMELLIEVPDMETQRHAVEVDKLSRQRERMYMDLINQERQLTEIAIRKIIGGTLI